MKNTEKEVDEKSKNSNQNEVSMKNKIKEIKEILKNKALWGFVSIVMVLICVILLLISEAQFPNGVMSSGIVAIISAVLGVILTVAVTTILLGKQSELQKDIANKQSELQKDLIEKKTEQEEEKEKQVKVFEKKQKIYHDFLEKLKDIIQDGEIHIGKKNKDGSLDSSVDDLKDLIFQLAYLQLHASKDAVNEVLKKVSALIQHLNDFNSTREVDKQKELSEFYSSFSNEIFGIVAILRKDLYPDKKDCNQISKEKMNEILRECSLFVETEDFDRYELQNYFWDELQKQLKRKGYEFKMKDFKHDISEYYARARNRHYCYGIEITLHVDDKTVRFAIEVENSYYYGFPKPEKEDTKLEQIIQEGLTGFKHNKYWYAWKYSDHYDLDFWKLNSEEFNRLKKPRKQEQLMIDITDEIDGHIQEFIKIAKQNNY
jgi:hypothetical protein